MTTMNLPIIQQWDPSPTLTNGLTNGTSSNLPTLDDLVARTAQENGIERPTTHTVSFHYNSLVEGHHFGRSHPMKPWRLQLTKQLILSYGLQYAMDCYETRTAGIEEMAEFHNPDYLRFLRDLTPDTMREFSEETQLGFGIGDDCPVFDGLYDYCSLYTGSTLSAVRTLMASNPPPTHAGRTSSRAPGSDIAVNWSGGLHHALKGRASGFCYVNDIVLAIQLLLTQHPRVLYIDIDVHHGDGVEHAFSSSDRVLTLSLHKYDPLEFFPGTGGPHSTGPENPHNPGAKYSLNLPLKDGIEDDQYKWLFDECVKEAVKTFQPTAIVLQCGGDSLGGDRLGKFNLNIRAHGHCVTTCRSFGLPLLLLGGGGYTPRNVARLWCHETALATDSQLLNTLPQHLPHIQAFTGPDRGSGQLYPSLTEIKHHHNEHDWPYLQEQRNRILEQLRYLKGAPSVQMARMPSDIWKLREDIEASMKEDDEEREDEDGDSSKGARGRRTRERNIGVRGEMP